MPDLATLFDVALKAHANAYAPYSRFKVGAAIRTESGAIFAGANVENAAYPQGACAEAAAIMAMVLGGERRIAEVLVVGEGDALVTPCGGDAANGSGNSPAPDTPIHMAGLEGHRATFTLSELLPHSFGPDHLAR